MRDAAAGPRSPGPPAKTGPGGVSRSLRAASVRGPLSARRLPAGLPGVVPERRGRLFSPTGLGEPLCVPPRPFGTTDRALLALLAQHFASRPPSSSPTFPLYSLRRPARQLRPSPCLSCAAPFLDAFLSVLPPSTSPAAFASLFPWHLSPGLRGHSAPSEVPWASAAVPSPSRRVPRPDARLAREPPEPPRRRISRRPRPRRAAASAAAAPAAAGNFSSPMKNCANPSVGEQCAQNEGRALS